MFTVYYMICLMGGQNAARSGSDTPATEVWAWRMQLLILPPAPGSTGASSTDAVLEIV